MMNSANKENLILAKMIKDAVEKKGCEISTIDLKNQVIKIDGPDELIGDCARAVADII